MKRRKLLFAERKDCQNRLMEMEYNRSPQKIVAHKNPFDPTSFTHTIQFLFKDRVDAKTFQLPRILEKEYSLSSRIFEMAKSKQTIEFYSRHATIDADRIKSNRVAEIAKYKQQLDEEW